MTRYISIKESELTELIKRSGSASESIPLSWRTNGCYIPSNGDGTAVWALNELAKIRGIK